MSIFTKSQSILPTLHRLTLKSTSKSTTITPFVDTAISYLQEVFSKELTEAFITNNSSFTLKDKLYETLSFEIEVIRWQKKLSSYQSTIKLTILEAVSSSANLYVYPNVRQC